MFVRFRLAWLMTAGLLLLFYLGVLRLGWSGGSTDHYVEVVHIEDERRVDVLVEGTLFTAYLYTDTIQVLKKPVLYPIITAGGNHITRGFPLAPRPGESEDHPHHIGMWLNYGNVSGLDFWNNSGSATPERADRMGEIRHREILLRESGPGTASLHVAMDWLGPDGALILREETEFTFSAEAGTRTIDRVTTLTAVKERVEMPDDKEGMIALRVAHSLEHGSSEDGRTGRYRSSAGVSGEDVWGTRAEWMELKGVVEDEPVTIVLIDHPNNVGFPTYWHARGYGLFAANPLGQAALSDGRDVLNLTLEAGESATWRYRLIVKSDEA